MKLYLIILTVLFPHVADAGNISLYECEGTETGKIESFTAKRQLIIECYNHSNNCSAKFFLNTFKVTLGKNGKYTDTAEGPDYFKFDPKTGKTQGVTQDQFHYFTGTCTKLVKP